MKPYPPKPVINLMFWLFCLGSSIKNNLFFSIERKNKQIKSNFFFQLKKTIFGKGKYTFF
jgi:hypothetical protein